MRGVSAFLRKSSNNNFEVPNVQSESLVQPSSWPEVEFRYILFPISVLLNFADFLIIRWTDRFSLSLSLSCVLEYFLECVCLGCYQFIGDAIANGFSRYFHLSCFRLKGFLC